MHSCDHHPVHSGIHQISSYAWTGHTQQRIETCCGLSLGYQLLGEFTLKELYNMPSLEASFTKYLVLQGNNPIVFNKDQLHTISFALSFQSAIPGGSRFSPLAVTGTPKEVPLTPALLPFLARQGPRASSKPRGDPEHT